MVKALEMFSGLYESLIGYARANRESLARSFFPKLARGLLALYDRLNHWMKPMIFI